MKYAMTWLLTAALLLGLCAGAMAQELVSVAELYEQAEAMGGVWRETFQTPNGEMTVDAPVIVPNIAAMPVLTVEEERIREDVYDRIAQGIRPEKRANMFELETELDGITYEFFFGNVARDEQCYDTIQTVWVQRGAYRFGVGTGMMDAATPSTFHFPWMLDPDEPCLRNSELTLGEVMRLWREDIGRIYPEGEFDIAPKTIAVRGSTLTDQIAKGKEGKRNGFFEISAEQLIGGVPVFGAIASHLGSSAFAIMFTNTQAINREVERLTAYGVGAASAYQELRAYASNAEDYRTIMKLSRVRSVECEDVPLAPLESVLAGIAREIEAGNIRRLYSVRLGYILYSNPDMTDYAFAIPRWAASVEYVTKKDAKNDQKTKEANARWGYEVAPWEEFYYEEIPIDAQSGEMILFTTGDEETFSVPELITWEKS